MKSRVASVSFVLRSCLLVIGLIMWSIPAAAGPAIGYWGGGSGTWETAANWAGSNSGPFTSTYADGGWGQAYIGQAGSAGTITMNGDFSSAAVIGIYQTGYTINLNGHTVTTSNSLSSGGGAIANFTLDFAGTSSQFLRPNSSAGDLATSFTQLTLSNYVVGSSVFRAGNDNGNGASGSGYESIFFFEGYTNGGAATVDASGFVTPTGVLAAVPEPSTYAIFIGLAVLGLAGGRRRR